MAIPTLLAGEIVPASKWADILSYFPLYAKKTANQDLNTSSTALQNVTSLSVALQANMTYEVDVYVRAFLSAGTTEDIDLAFTFPAGATCEVYSVTVGALTSVVGNSSADMALVTGQATSGVSRFGAGLSTTPDNTIMRCRVVMGATAGNFQVQASQHVSGTNIATVAADSEMVARRVA